MIRKDFSKITKEGCWELYAQLLLNEPKPPFKIMEQFATHWIEAGHKIREQIANDRTLVNLLRHMLPLK